MGLIVNTPEPMSRVRVVSAKDYSDETLKTLHRAGVLHVEQSEELRPIDREALEREIANITDLLTDIRDVLAYAPKGETVSLGEDIEVIYARPLEEIDTDTRSLCTKLTNMHHQATQLAERIEALTQLKTYLQPLGQQLDIRLSDLSFSGSCLSSRVFVLPSGMYETIHSTIKSRALERLDITVADETLLYVITKSEDRESIESGIVDAGGRALTIPSENVTPEEFLEVADDRIHNIEEELARINGEIEDKTRENLRTLVLLREALSAENERLSVLRKACEAKYVTLVEGWIPESNVESAISELKENVGYVFIDSRQPEKSEMPPTKLRNAHGLKPFQVIVNLFGIPKYGEWDPTPIIAYSFAFFFGLMIGDVPYAVCIILFARFLLPRFVDDPESEGARLFQRLLFISSTVGIVVGLLTGTYMGNFYAFFGIESLAISKAIAGVFEDALTFIVFSLVIGLIHVNIAHVLALIKGIRQRQRSVVPGKVGLFILQIAGIPWIMHAILHVDIPLLTAYSYSILLYVMILGIILIIISSFMERGAFLGGIFWLFDVTGILGDVMSYCRIAGVGLATYYLAFCFNLMAPLLSDMVPAGPGGIVNLVFGSLIAIFILLIGHSINLILAAITCFVHSLRLCFVEFLFKFYEGGGREYSPFRLRKRTLVPVKGRA